MNHRCGQLSKISVPIRVPSLFLLVIPAKAGGALQQRSWSSSAFDAAKTLDPSFRWDDGEAISKVILSGYSLNFAELFKQENVGNLRL
jgi:hypothetical protein